MNTKFCPNCGTKVAADVQRCPNCGHIFADQQVPQQYSNQQPQRHQSRALLYILLFLVIVIII